MRWLSCILMGLFSTVWYQGSIGNSYLKSQSPSELLLSFFGVVMSICETLMRIGLLTVALQKSKCIIIILQIIIIINFAQKIELENSFCSTKSSTSLQTGFPTPAVREGPHSSRSFPRRETWTALKYDAEIEPITTLVSFAAVV